MPRLTRAIKEARRLLADQPLKSAMVPVQKIARQFAHVLGQTLPDEISGVLVPLASPVRGKAWTIVYNSHHSRVRQRFTIAHELGHLLLHSFTVPHADRGFKLRFRNAESSEGSVLEEIEANQFAAELLMPRELVVAEAARLGLDYADPDGDDLEVLAETFKVSRLAISIRVGNLAGVVA